MYKIQRVMYSTELKLRLLAASKLLVGGRSSVYLIVGALCKNIIIIIITINHAFYV